MSTSSYVPSGVSVKDAEEVRRILSRSRVLLVGAEPWGAVAAAALASAGLGALHVLDDRPVTAADLGAVRFFVEADRDKERVAALAAALSRIAPGCAVTSGELRATAGAPLALEDTRWDVVLACVPGDDLLVLQAVARFAHAAGLPSISAALDGLETVIGPAVVPGKTACWNCGRLRRLGNSDQAEADQALHESLLSERPRPRLRTCLSPAPALAGQMLALAAIDLLTNGAGAALAGSMLVHNLVTSDASSHRVLAMPHCEVCGGAFAMHRDGVAPEGNGVNIGAARDPAELMRMLAGVADARTGIVRHVIVKPSDSSLDPEAPIAATAMLARNVAACCQHHGNEPELGAGKGTTIVSAMISAVGEAVERYSAGRFDHDALLVASVAEMKGDFLAPEQLCLYGDSQYGEADFPFARLAPTTKIAWTRGFWLDTRAPVHVPALVAYMNFPAPQRAYFCEVTSNGLAAGATLEDAALGAALELVERDAFMITWLGKRPGRRVLIDASIDAGAREACRQLEERGVRVELYLLDVGLGIPTVVCAGYGDGESWPGATVSLSAHLSPRVAVEKALLEQGHIGPFLRRMVVEEKKAIPQRPEDVHTLDDHALYYVPPSRAQALAFMGAAGTVAVKDLPEPAEISTAELSRRVTAAGLRMAIVDVTSPDLANTPFRVARAIGAGFQQIHFGHRLARLGNPRLVALAPDGINPDPHPLA